MKISIALESKSKFYVDLPIGRANQLYKKLTTLLIECSDMTTFERVANITNSNSENKETIADVKEKFKEVGKEIGRSLERVSMSQIKYTPQVNKNELVNTNGEIKKNLVMIKCKKCGQVATPTLFMKNRELVHKEHSLTCRECGEELPLITEIKNARYNCPNCNTNAGFYVANELKEVTCKECGSPIDLVWHEKRELYLSANLLEKGDK